MASYLIDTCALLWALSASKKLSRKAKEIIEEPSHRIFVSHASLWEMSIKVSIGKLTVPKGFFEEIHEMGYETLATKEEHFSVFRKLPLIHRDPFDRLLVAQSLWEKCPLLTCDPETIKYRAQTVW